MQRSKILAAQKERREQIYSYYIKHGFTETAKFYNLTNSRIAKIVQKVLRDNGE